MFSWLRKAIDNVVVIHCNSGKGRAGTACCCLLLFSGFYDNILECAKHFGARRFTDKKGISQPCQVRFIHYFEAFYKNIVKSPQVKVLTKMTLFGVPNTSTLKASGSKLYYEIFRVGEHFRHDLLYTNKDKKDQVRFRYCEEGMINFEIENLELYGNIMIQFKSIGQLSTTNLFRITFNTAFLNIENKVQIKRLNISPESLHKNTTTF